MGNWLGFQQNLQQMGAKKAAQQQAQQQFMQKILLSVIQEQIKQQFAKPKATSAKDILGVAGGITPPGSVFPQEDIESVSPGELGQAGGGKVLTPPGSRFTDGQIISPEGKGIGEFLPGYEPRRATEAFPASIRQRFGVTEEEAKRKFLGLGKAKKEKTGPTTAQKKAIGSIESGLTKMETGAVDFDPNAMGLFIAKIQKAGLDPTDPIFEEVLEKARKFVETQKPKGLFGRFRK